MSVPEVDELGPVDYLVVEFPAGAQHFTGEMASALGDLIEDKTVRLLDLLVLSKGDDGSIDAMEVEDLAQLDDLRVAETQLADILAADDVTHLAAAMDPGSVAGVIVWENLWAAPFAAAARHAGGQLVASGRIPIQAIAASFEAETAVEEGA